MMAHTSFYGGASMQADQKSWILPAAIVFAALMVAWTFRNEVSVSPRGTVTTVNRITGSKTTCKQAWDSQNQYLGWKCL